MGRTRREGPDEDREDPGRLELREARASDAAALCSYRRAVLNESEFLLQGPEDWQEDVAAERGLIDAFAHHPRSVLLIAVEHGPGGALVVGMCTLVGGPYLRNAHVGTLGMAVRRSHQGRGIGRQLLDAALQWAARPGHLHKVALQVHVENRVACGLYRAAGFEVEGTLRGEATLAGRPADLYAMGRFLSVDLDPG